MKIGYFQFSPKLFGVKQSFSTSAFEFYFELDKELENFELKKVEHIGRPKGIASGINQKCKHWN